MEKIINELKVKELLNKTETFNLYKNCSVLICEDLLKGQELLINILDNKFKLNSEYDQILADLIESVGFYPYLEKENFELKSTSALIRKEYHCSDYLTKKYFHEDQKYLLNLLQTSKNVIVSAPTSFGKSLLIEEIVASKKYKNIVVIQPTLALLDETRKKLLKYVNDYKLIIKTSQESTKDKRNIYLFTAERVNEYQYFVNIDLLIIDEFYKLSGFRDDERADSLNNAFYYLLKKFNPKFYLLGPNIDSISSGFEDKYNAVFYKTKSSLVYNEKIDFYLPYKEEFENANPKNNRKKNYQQAKLFKEFKLFELLFSLKNEQTIIYCSSPNRVRYLAKELINFLKKDEIDYIAEPHNFPIIEWIQENISETWSLIEFLNMQIAVHDGTLQKHITSSVIDYFNEGKLKYLFCTTTIIEGINTSAKNIVFFDPIKGKDKQIDFFDYSNIKGRAGRLMVHYVGKIYNFNPEPIQTQVMVDIPFFQQNPIKEEVLIHLEENEILDKQTPEYKNIESLTPEEKPIIAKNQLLVMGQKCIINQLREDIDENYNLICWSGTPNYKQLSYCIKLGWDYLMKKEESRSLGIKKLVNKTFNYGMHGSISYLIQADINYIKECVLYYSNNIGKEPIEKGKYNYGEKYVEKNETEIFDEIIMVNFQILKHWFQYKIPKWLSVINSLQEFVCNERGVRAGSYMHYANIIENEHVRENLALLLDFGVPNSAIKKLERLVPPNLLQDDAIQFIKEKNIWNSKEFIEYEKNIINKSL